MMSGRSSIVLWPAHRCGSVETRRRFIRTASTPSAFRNAVERSLCSTCRIIAGLNSAPIVKCGVVVVAEVVVNLILSENGFISANNNFPRTFKTSSFSIKSTRHGLVNVSFTFFYPSVGFVQASSGSNRKNDLYLPVLHRRCCCQSDNVIVTL